MRMLVLSNLYPPHDLGGWEQNCAETVRHLGARRHACRVLTSRYGVDGREGHEPGVTRALHLEAGIHYYRPLAFFLQRPWHERANRAALRRAIVDFAPDVIFIWGMWLLSADLAYCAEQWCPGRVAYAVAGYWPIGPNAHQAYWAMPARRPVVERAKGLLRPGVLRRLAAERAAHPLRLERVACVSRYVRDKLVAADAISPTARVIYNGVDPAPFEAASRVARPLQPGRLRLLYFGGLAEHKGVHTAIAALALLKARGLGDRLSLTILGGGHPDYVAHLRAMVDRHGLSAGVSFVGRVPRAEVPAHLAEHDVFLFTSTYEEPIARTVMEAMAAGLLVIGTAVGGQAEMLEDGENALVYPPGDAAALSERIAAVLENPRLLARIAAVGRETVLQRFTLDRMVDEMEAWLQEIVA